MPHTLHLLYIYFTHYSSKLPTRLHSAVVAHSLFLGVDFFQQKVTLPLNFSFSKSYYSEKHSILITDIVPLDSILHYTTLNQAIIRIYLNMS